MVIYFCWDFAASFVHLNAELFRYADGMHAAAAGGALNTVDLLLCCVVSTSAAIFFPSLIDLVLQ